MMPALQPLEYCKVIGRFVATVADGVDTDDFPDAVPLQGSITFTPSLRSIKVATALPDPATVLPTPITVTLDEQGYVSWRGKRGVFLVAPTAATNPVAWNYTVTFDLALGSQRLSYPPFAFDAPVYVPGSNPADPDEASTVVDLTVAAPVYPSSGTPITLGPHPVSVSVVAKSLVFHMSDGSDLPPVPLHALEDLQSAADSAAAARDAAIAARTGAESARDAAAASANDALTHRNAAQSAYSNTIPLHNAALQYRNDAQAAAATATTKAGEASTSATNAANSATTASTKATESGTSATNAAGSASTASTKAGEATTAKVNAESARDAAIAAKVAAEAARDQAIGGVVPDNSVTTPKIVNGAVTLAKLANNSVDKDKIVVNGVTTANIADGAVTSAKIASGAVTLMHLGSTSVDNSKIVDGAITGAKIANGTIASTKLAGSVQASLSLADTSVQPAALAGKAAKLNDRGAWSATATYQHGDVVTASGARWYYTSTAASTPGAWNNADWVFTGGPAIGTVAETAMRGDGIQLVASLPGSPVAGVLYCVPE